MLNPDSYRIGVKLISFFALLISGNGQYYIALSADWRTGTRNELQKALAENAKWS